MKEIRSQKALAVILSKIKGFPSAKVRVEQYMTPSQIAAEVLWHAYMRGHLEGKEGADFGCGTGILGIGALIMGASAVHFIDSDPEAIEMAKKNLSTMESEGYIQNLADRAVFYLKDIKDVKLPALDFVLENPPFGTQKRHADKPFLQKALDSASLVYSFHSADSEPFLKAVAKEKGFSITEAFSFQFALPKTMAFHTKKIYYIPVGCFLFEK